MKKLFILTFIMASSLGSTLFASELDSLLKRRIEYFRITPYNPVVSENTQAWQARVALGEYFYTDGRLSGNKNITCMRCHHEFFGTSDNEPLSLNQSRDGILARNSSSLFNIGDPKNHYMFWDGRVHLDPRTGVFTTPEPAFNGVNPKASHITKVLSSAASAQALFPMVNREEMRGHIGDNEIANAANNLEAWELIVKRLLNPKNDDYQRVLAGFKMSYPNLQEEEINIGHVAEAIYTFMKVKFMSNQSPFHQYISGDSEALTIKQKRGFEIFTGKGRCITCHQGNLLRNNSLFSSIGIPSYGAESFEIDQGRKDFTFKTPSLINVGVTGPYMHNGVFKTIREVIDHYSNIEKSLKNFDVTPEMRVDFPVYIEARNAPEEVEAIWNSIRLKFLKEGLHFTENEKDDLEEFLLNGLTDPKWKPARR